MSTSDHLAASSGVIAEAWDQATVSRTVARLVVLDTAREMVSGSPRASIQLLAQAFQRRTGLRIAELAECAADWPRD